jgi:hypothetical protein
MTRRSGRPSVVTTRPDSAVAPAAPVSGVIRSSKTHGGGAAADGVAAPAIIEGAGSAAGRNHSSFALWRPNSSVPCSIRACQSDGVSIRIRVQVRSASSEPDRVFGDEPTPLRAVIASVEPSGLTRSRGRPLSAPSLGAGPCASRKSLDHTLPSRRRVLRMVHLIQSRDTDALANGLSELPRDPRRSEDAFHRIVR